MNRQRALDICSVMMNNRSTSKVVGLDLYCSSEKLISPLLLCTEYLSVPRH